MSELTTSKNILGRLYNGCVNDAKDMAALHKELLGFKNDDITILTDAHITTVQLD